MKKVKNFLKGVTAGLVIFVTLGLVAHAFVGLFSDPEPNTIEKCEGYSLKNRFCCAFSFSTTEAQSHYYNNEIDSNECPVGKTHYLAHPIATYSFILLCGAFGAFGLNERKKK